MTKFTLVSIFSILATACTTMNPSMPKSDTMMSDKMAAPTMEKSTDKSMHDTKMMGGMEKKTETPEMPGKKM